MLLKGLPGGTCGKESACSCSGSKRWRCWFGKIWRSGQQLTAVLLPGASHGQRSLAGYSPLGCKESDTTETTQLSLMLFKVWAIQLCSPSWQPLPTDSATPRFSSRTAGQCADSVPPVAKLPGWLSSKRTCLPTQKLQETWVQSLGWNNPLEKEMVIHSSILAWNISQTEEPQSMGSQRAGLDWAGIHVTEGQLSRPSISYAKNSSLTTPKLSMVRKCISNL